MNISLIIACVQNMRVGHWPNFPAIHLYVFPSCSSKFTQLLAALVGNVNHILKSACSPLGQKEPFSIFDRKLSKLKLHCGRECALKTPKNVAEKNESSLVTMLVLSLCAVQLRVNVRSHHLKLPNIIIISSIAFYLRCCFLPQAPLSACLMGVIVPFFEPITGPGGLFTPWSSTALVSHFFMLSCSITKWTQSELHNTGS